VLQHFYNYLITRPPQQLDYPDHMKVEDLQHDLIGWFKVENVDSASIVRAISELLVFDKRFVT
jgi:hypothetical protein